jgi:hypothetical protein
MGVDATPVKVMNTEGKQFTFEAQPVGANVEITVSGTNDAGEDPGSEPIAVTVT